MSFSVPTGKPGVLTTYTSTPRQIFLGNAEKASVVPGPITVDGTASGNALNSPYTWLLYAGMPMGEITATKKFANSILGLSGTATSASATSIHTDVNTAAELVRRIGASGTFTIVGPPTAGGTVASETVTYSAVNLSTGVITCSAVTNAYVTASLIQPTDGSQTVKTLLLEEWGLAVIDQLKATRQDVFGKLWAGGGVIDVSYIPNYPSDASLKTWLKAAIKAFVPNALFSDDYL